MQSNTESNTPETENPTSSENTSDTANDILENQSQVEAQAELDPLQALEKKHAELNERFLLVAADLQNLQRRSEKEKRDMMLFGNEKLIKDFLPALDAFDKALCEKTDDKNSASVWEGVELIYSSLSKTLEKYGLQKLNTKEVVFDPNLHQAIQKVEKPELANETVIQEFASGYTLNGRLLRAAMVLVGTPSGEGPSK